MEYRDGKGDKIGMPCSHSAVIYCYIWLVSFAFSKKEEEHGQSVKIMFTCISYLVWYFIPFLQAVIFSHVLHLDDIRSQIELKLKAHQNFLCIAIMQNNHCHPYIHIHVYTVLPYCVI